MRREKLSKKILKYAIPIFIMFIFISSSFVFIRVGATEKQITLYILPGENAPPFHDSIIIHKNTTLGDILKGLGINYTLKNGSIDCLWGFCSTNDTRWYLYVGDDFSSMRRVEFNLNMSVWNSRIIMLTLLNESKLYI